MVCVPALCCPWALTRRAWRVPSRGVRSGALEAGVGLHIGHQPRPRHHAVCVQGLAQHLLIVWSQTSYSASLILWFLICNVAIATVSTSQGLWGLNKLVNLHFLVSMVPGLGSAHEVGVGIVLTDFLERSLAISLPLWALLNLVMKQNYWNCPAGVAPLVELHPVHGKVSGMIQGQGTYLGCWFNPQSKYIRKATCDVSLSHQCINVSLSVCLSVPLSKSTN